MNLRVISCGSFLVHLGVECMQMECIRDKKESIRGAKRPALSSVECCGNVIIHTSV